VLEPTELQEKEVAVQECCEGLGQGCGGARTQVIGMEDALSLSLECVVSYSEGSARGVIYGVTAAQV